LLEPVEQDACPGGGSGARLGAKVHQAKEPVKQEMINSLIFAKGNLLTIDRM